ncbi:MAG: efflux RND transporter periplasmic adaptor subunit [Burkholderiales bacterium]|jgi:membrane fusion protein (multidrug efflux system)|nr:efflux RND transporter periplasmic adaptor subunit [Burkholderiales bacterium]
MQGLIKAVIFATVALSVLSGCEEKKAQQMMAGEAVRVGVVEVGARKVTIMTELPGRTSPYLVAEVRPQVGGIIQKRLFKEGGDVKSGEILYQIDPAIYQATYNSAVATLTKAEANLASSKARAERYAELVKINAVSRQDSDDTDAAYKQAIADVEAAKAAVESASINLNYTRVTSPISGRIGKSEVTPGALVTASQPAALTKVQQLNPIYVDVTQSSVEWLRFKHQVETGLLKTDAKNQIKVKLQLEDGRVYPKEGKLEFSDVTVDETTGMITLRAIFPNPNNDLLPGMYVRALIEEGVNEAAITIPQKALFRNQKGEPQVIVVKPDNTIEQRVIGISREYEKDWLVSSGLSLGEKILVEGSQNLRGTNIKVNPVLVDLGQSNGTDNHSAPATESAAKL